jgi:predicted RNase H-like HicB family nuclease
MKREFSVVYTPIEDGWIMAQVPELPGAVTQGRDMDEAREMIQEAVELLCNRIARMPRRTLRAGLSGKRCRSKWTSDEATVKD